MKKKMAVLVIGLTILIMLGGIQATFLYGAEFLTTKPGFTFSIIHGPAYGVITAAVVSSFEWEPTSGRQPATIRLGTSEYYLISCIGPDDDGWVYTLRVWNNNGTIQQSVVDSYEFFTTDIGSSSIVHVSGDVYAIAYRDFEAPKWICVETITANDTNGDISNVIDTINLTSDGQYPNIQYVSDKIFSVAYQRVGTNNHGLLDTIYITDDGMIGDTLNDSVEFDTSNIIIPHSLMIDSDTLAIIYGDESFYGKLVTINISSTGDITNTVASSWTFDSTPNILYVDIGRISGNVYGISYADSDSDGQVKTLTIANTGAITKSWIDTLEFAPANTVSYLKLFTVMNASVYGVACKDTSGGLIRTMNISSTGTIGDAIIDTFTFDVDCFWYPTVLYVNKSYYLIVYPGPDTGGSFIYDGWSKTVTILTNWASPAFSSSSPTNSSTGVALTPTCAITVNDMNADTMTISWYTNMTGSWVLHQTNSSATNGTYRWAFTEASTINTKYWWKVYANDGIYNVSAWYYFTTS